MIVTVSLLIPKFFAAWCEAMKMSIRLSYFLARRSCTFLAPTLGIMIVVPNGKALGAAMVVPARGRRPLAVGWLGFPQHWEQWQYAVMVMIAILVTMKRKNLFILRRNSTKNKTNLANDNWFVR